MDIITGVEHLIPQFLLHREAVRNFVLTALNDLQFYLNFEAHDHVEKNH